MKVWVAGWCRRIYGVKVLKIDEDGALWMCMEMVLMGGSKGVQ